MTKRHISSNSRLKPTCSEWGAAKKWVLLANALDESMMRNYLAFNLGKALGLEFTSDCQFLNLYINGQYKGVYLLCEQVQEGSNRVNINTSPVGQVDTGYLLEGINNASPVDYKTFKLNDVNGKSLGKGAFNIYYQVSRHHSVHRRTEELYFGLCCKSQ